MNGEEISTGERDGKRACRMTCMRETGKAGGPHKTAMRRVFFFYFW